MLIRLSLCISEKELQDKLRNSLAESDVMLESFGHHRSPWQKVIRSCADIIVISESLLPQPLEMGIAMLNELPENPTTIIIHDDSSSEGQARLVAAGADLAIYSGVSLPNISNAIQSVIESRVQYAIKTTGSANREFRPKLSDFSSNSDTMRVFMQEVTQFIPSNAPLLLLGETGVGKEHLARAIHSESPRSGGPFVTVNTAALPEQLLESELFGHTQGAFTGAARSRRGAFELAHHGTIFLDEIGEMPLHLQAKLLRTLQDYEVKPLGSEKPIWVDVRVIAASNRDLEEEINQNNFRKDLFYRLSVISLTIPPLRQRREDIPGIAQNFLERQQLQHGYEVEAISEEAMEALCRYDWPGNVRELFNVLERAILLCEGIEITIADLPQIFRSATLLEPLFPYGTDTSSWSGKTLNRVLNETQGLVEQAYLESVLRETKGRLGAAAQRAGISSRSLYNKMKKLGLRKERYR
ncbi:MAG TPA: sigma-54 dependent transcriptional regulator [bacterium]|nr:sigma-54 dependent transcriptional regulator [bacterium]HPJ71124.1 sigma-54 dependent transcriptional regulator [bacterium]HPQ66444.1 sigma-54 dependent transcriptional regulator [bacterium]